MRQLPKAYGWVGQKVRINGVLLSTKSTYLARLAQNEPSGVSVKFASITDRYLIDPLATCRHNKLVAVLRAES